MICNNILYVSILHYLEPLGKQNRWFWNHVS